MSHAYLGPLHPRFRFEKVEDFSSETIDLLLQALQPVAAVLPHPPVAIELCGSAAIGCLRPWSDLDINFAPDSWETKRLIDEWFQDKENAQAFYDAMADATQIVQAKMHILSTTPDNKQTTMCYDLQEHQLYNRTPGEPLWGRYVMEKFPDGTHCWNYVPKVAKVTVDMADPFFPGNRITLDPTTWRPS